MPVELITIGSTSCLARSNEILSKICLPYKKEWTIDSDFQVCVFNTTKRKTCKFFRWVCQMCLQKGIIAMWHQGPKFRRCFLSVARLQTTQYVVRGYGMNNNDKYIIWCAFCRALHKCEWTESTLELSAGKNAWIGLQGRLTCSWFMIYVAKQTWNLNCPTLAFGTWNAVLPTFRDSTIFLSIDSNGQATSMIYSVQL